MIFRVELFQGDPTGLNARLEGLQSVGCVILTCDMVNINQYFFTFQEPQPSQPGLFDKLKSVVGL